MKINKRVFFTMVICILVAGFGGYWLGSARVIPNTKTTSKEVVSAGIFDVARDKFPPLDMPIEYFDAKQLSLGWGSDYNVIIDADSYRSYPSTSISFKYYSNTPVPLPLVKSDKEIFTSNDDFDSTETRKKENIKQYGDLARRFISEDTCIDDILNVDLDNDGKNETVLYLSLYGANVGSSWIEVVKDNNVVFSVSDGIFADLVPAKNRDGFFIKWNIEKEYDGYITTRFIFDGSKFVPVYEQETRYIRILNKRSK